MSEEFYDEDYFLRGPESGKSNYRDYHWMEAETLAMADHIIRHLHLKEGDYVMDFGCARGYLVKAFNMRKVHAVGYDISKWAIANCDPAVTSLVSNDLITAPSLYDSIIAKDNLEHIPISQLKVLIPALCNSTKKSLLFIVPLTAYTNGTYLRVEDEADTSHVVRQTLQDWLLLLTQLAPDFTVSGSYHIKGIKPASLQVPQSTGFFTLSRQSNCPDEPK